MAVKILSRNGYSDVVVAEKYDALTALGDVARMLDGCGNSVALCGSDTLDLPVWSVSAPRWRTAGFVSDVEVDE